MDKPEQTKTLKPITEALAPQLNAYLKSIGPKPSETTNEEPADEA